MEGRSMHAWEDHGEEETNEPRMSLRARDSIIGVRRQGKAGRGLVVAGLECLKATEAESWEMMGIVMLEVDSA